MAGGISLSSSTVYCLHLRAVVNKKLSFIKSFKGKCLTVAKFMVVPTSQRGVHEEGLKDIPVVGVSKCEIPFCIF